MAEASFWVRWDRRGIRRLRFSEQVRDDRRLSAQAAQQPLLTSAGMLLT